MSSDLIAEEAKEKFKNVRFTEKGFYLFPTKDSTMRLLGENSRMGVMDPLNPAVMELLELSCDNGRSVSRQLEYLEEIDRRFGFKEFSLTPEEIGIALDLIQKIKK